MSDIISEIENVKELNKNIGVYCVSSKISNIIYIGKSIDLQRRLKQHSSDIKGLRYRYGGEGVDKNTDFLKSMHLIGEENIKYDILANCPKSILPMMEKYYLDIFKRLGYTVFGDGSREKIYVEPFVRDIEMRDREYLGIANLDKRYQIIISEYKQESDEYNRKSYTEFLIDKMIEGIQYYNNFNLKYKDIIEKYMETKVNFVDSALNYVAYRMYYKICTNEKMYINSYDVYFGGFKGEEKLIGGLPKKILYRIKNDYMLNNQLIEWIIYYTNNFFWLLDLTISERVVKISQRLNIEINNMFDFVYYYIITIGVEKDIFRYG